MTPVQSGDKLCEDAPDIFLLSKLIPGDERLNHLAQVAPIAVLHVNVEFLRRLEVFPVIVADNVWMTQGMEDGEFGLELFTLFVRHTNVADFFATHFLVERLVRILSDIEDKEQCTFLSDILRTLCMMPNEPCPR